MLNVVKGKSRAIEKAERKENSLYLYSGAGIHRIEPKNDAVIRVTYTQREEFSNTEKPGVLLRTVFPDWDYMETDTEIWLKMRRLTLVVNKKTASYSYFDSHGKRLLKERERESKNLEEFTVYRLETQSSRIEKVHTPDGDKEVVMEAAKVPLGKSYHTRMYLEWAENEALYGLGQHEEGFASLRGQTLYLHQANRKIAIPMLVSTLGYGILVDTYSPLIFSDTLYGSYIYTEADPEMDFYFINGESMDGVIAQYRSLTGKTTILPRWAYGYIQSQERYETKKEILDTVKEYRERNIGLDGIVLDWCSWKGNLWGQKTFDETRFPDPDDMMEQLHEAQVHFMLSIWPNMDQETENYKEFAERQLLLPGCSIYNALSAEGRQLYWEQVKRGLYAHGVDAWWCDSSEPFTPEWNHVERTEPAKMYAEYCETTENHLPAEKTNAYALYHAQGIYEGQRGEQDNEKRVFNLTRSAWTGQQRFGTVLWSGDIEASWETLRKQIAAGLHFSASGLPFWTVDIGAFFVKNGNLWFWKGHYDAGTEDLGYRELFVRWYQWACFLPVFRGHGTDCRRELWHFENTEIPFYDVLVQMNHLRYTLMPYIYSCAGLCWLKDRSMMKLLAFAYPEETAVFHIMDQYLFGEELMVCPVTEPMYYGENSSELTDTVKTRRVYLPEAHGWYDYWTNTYYEGGQWIEVCASIDRIPLFVKEGGILLKTDFAGSTKELDGNCCVTVYTGRDGCFDFYEDEGEGYDYEEGKYRLTRLTWKEADRTLSTEVMTPESQWSNIDRLYQIQKVYMVEKE